MLERRVQVALEEIGRFHDVHVGVDESEAVLHDVLLHGDRDAIAPGMRVARTISGSGGESSGPPPLAAARTRGASSAAMAPGAADGHEVRLRLQRLRRTAWRRNRLDRLAPPAWTPRQKSNSAAMKAWLRNARHRHTAPGRRASD